MSACKYQANVGFNIYYLLFVETLNFSMFFSIGFRLTWTFSIFDFYLNFLFKYWDVASLSCNWSYAAKGCDVGNCYKITCIVPCLSGRIYVKLMMVLSVNSSGYSILNVM